MKIDKNKLDLLLARNCMELKELIESAELATGTGWNLCNLTVRPKTAGKVAKALGVDVTEIIKEED